MKKLLLITLGFSLLNACSQVETGEVGIKTSFGAVTGQPLPPGIYFYLPGVSTINILTTRVQTTSDKSNAASKDLQNVNTQITVNYNLGLENPIEHFKRLGSDPKTIENNIVKPTISETFKSVVALYNAEELVTKRNEVSTKINNLLADKLKQYDLYVDSVAITNFGFSDKYMEAVENKQIAQQLANKAQNDLQRIQIEAQQKIVEAQGQAKAMELQKNVLTPELIDVKRLEIQSKMIDKWNGVLPTYSSSNPLNFFVQQNKTH